MIGWSPKVSRDIGLKLTIEDVQLQIKDLSLG
jgi:hypothetical protein